ncbi:MAG: hypothetical protein EOP06_01520 [Proteobacteria bacterium]|nr:MAG: hypothetical protein EOP06_01520 [Pseudomonadota bacterium]
MNDKRSLTISLAIDFVRRFGFLTYDLFGDLLGSVSRFQKFRRWQELLESGCFKPSQKNPKVLYLTQKGFRRAGPNAVKRKYFYHVDHDSIVAKLVLRLKHHFVISSYWTETELKMFAWDAIGVLGVEDLNKIPDLVVDFKTVDGFVRVAFEIEASRKSADRYDQIALAYLEMNRVDLVLYGCATEQIEEQVLRAFTGEAFETAGKCPATFSLVDFSTRELSASTLFWSRSMSLADLLLASGATMSRHSRESEDATRVSSSELSEGVLKIKNAA